MSALLTLGRQRMPLPWQKSQARRMREALIATPWFSTVLEDILVSAVEEFDA